VKRMRFIADAWGHKAGDVVEYEHDFVVCLKQEGVAVEVDAEPNVERAVAPQNAETADIRR